MDVQLRRTLIEGNIIKHVIVTIVLLLSLIVLLSFQAGLVPEDGTRLQVLSGILALTFGGAMAGALAFTYKESALTTRGGRFFAHFITGLFGFIIFFILEIFVVAANELVAGGPVFWCILLVAVLGYVAGVFWDFWDLLRFIGEYSKDYKKAR